MKSLPIELFLYQKGGGVLPTITNDFIELSGTSSMKMPLLNLEPTAYDPADNIALRNSFFAEDQARLNEARIKAQEAKTELAEKEFEEEKIAAENKRYDNYVKDLNKGLAAMEKSINPITGLADLPGSKPILDNLNMKTRAFKDKMNEITSMQLAGTKITPDKFKELDLARVDMEKIYEDPQYRKLLVAQEAYKAFTKDVTKYKGGTAGKIVIPSKVEEYGSKLSKFLTDPASEITDINELTYDDAFFDEKDFLTRIDKGVKAFVEGNTDLITEFFRDDPVSMRTNKTLVTDLREPSKFVNTYVDYIKSSSKGRAYMQHIGGEEALRSEILNKAKMLNPNIGELVEQQKGTTITRDPNYIAPARSGGGSGGGKPTQMDIKVQGVINDLAKLNIKFDSPDNVEKVIDFAAKTSSGSFADAALLAEVLTTGKTVKKNGRSMTPQQAQAFVDTWGLSLITKGTAPGSAPKAPASSGAKKGWTVNGKTIKGN